MSRITIACPAPAGSRHGNRITALRWARILRGLGHRVRLAERWDGEACDLLLALHARRSAAAVARFHAAKPGTPIVVALTGTDLYRDLPRTPAARRTLELASRIVVLQDQAPRALPRRLRSRTHVIYQSGKPIRRRRAAGRRFEVVLLAHLRPEKDPLRGALAARLLPSDSRIRITHLGRGISPTLAARAKRETARNPRYRWLGERPHATALATLARCDILLLTSRMEGAANAVSEALAAGVPVIATRVPGLVGMLGLDHPGLFPCGDTAALGRLLLRAENDGTFYRRLEQSGARRARLVRPQAEVAAWRTLLRGL